MNNTISEYTILHPRKILWEFVTQKLDEYRDKNKLTVKSVCETFMQPTGLSSRTIRRFMIPDKDPVTKDIIYPNVESHLMLLNGLFLGIKFEEILKIVPKETISLLCEVRSHTNRDVVFSPEFDKLIIGEPDMGLIFFLADQKAGVKISKIKEKFGKNGEELVAKLIIGGYLSRRATKLYTTSTYPTLDLRAKTSIISRYAMTAFQNEENNEIKSTVGLYRADLSRENYIKAKDIIKAAYRQIDALDKLDSENELLKMNCVFFSGLTVIDDNSSSNTSELLH